MILLAALAVLFGAAASAQEPLLSTDTLEVTLTSAVPAAGEAALTLCWINHTPDEVTLQLFAPLINGEPASFLFGWPSEEIRLAPGSETEIIITLYADDPLALAQTASLRFILAGEVSSAGIINLADGGSVQQEAILAPGAELPLVESAVQWEDSSSALLLEDALTPEQTALLDYGQLRVCIRREVSGQEELIPFVTIPAQVSPEGKVTASFSGYAAECSAAPGFPLLTEETSADGIVTHTVRDMNLSGPFIFYSSLGLTLEEDPQSQTVTLTRQALDSPDVGHILHAPPLCLFDTLSLSLPVYQAAQQGDVITMTTTDVLFTTLPVEAPLTFRLVPAASLGELAAYFEYFFLDQSDVIHPVIPLI